MKIKTLISCAAIAVSTSGCLSFPKTESEMRNQSPMKNTFVVDQTLADAFQVVLDNANRCYGLDIIPWGRNTISGEKIESNAAVVRVRSDTTAGSGIAQLFDLRSITNVSTEITGYYTSMASKSFPQVAPGWFAGNKKCF